MLLSSSRPKTTSHTNKPPSTFPGPSPTDNILLIWSNLQTPLAQFLLWFNLPLFWTTVVLLVSEVPFPWLFDVLPWSEVTDLIVIIVFLDVWMLLTLTVGFTGALGYEAYWNPYLRAPSLRGRVGREEEAEMARVGRVGGRRLFGAGWLIDGRFWS